MIVSVRANASAKAKTKTTTYCGNGGFGGALSGSVSVSASGRCQLGGDGCLGEMVECSCGSLESSEAIYFGVVGG